MYDAIFRQGRALVVRHRPRARLSHPVFWGKDGTALPRWDRRGDDFRASPPCRVACCNAIAALALPQSTERRADPRTPRRQNRISEF